MIMELASHSEKWVLEKLGHKWLGFQKKTLLNFMGKSGFSNLQSEVLPFQRQEIFQIILCSGRKS